MDMVGWRDRERGTVIIQRLDFPVIILWRVLQIRLVRSKARSRGGRKNRRGVEVADSGDRDGRRSGEVDEHG